jgi:flagellin
MVINTNIPSARAGRILSESTNNLARSLAKLSSGSRLASPEDDAAGMAVSMKFNAEIKRIGAAKTNVGNASSFSQTQDGFLNKVNTALQRMSELATLAADGTKTADDVGNYNKEFQELKAFVNSSATKTFNSVSLFSVTLDNTSITAPNATGVETAIAVKTAYDALVAEIATFKAAAPVAATTTALEADILALANEYKKITEGFSAAVAHTNYAAASTVIEGATVLNKTYATALTPAGIDEYIAQAEDFRDFIGTKYGGMKVTDASDASTYTMKAVDLTSIKDDMGTTGGDLTTLTYANAASYVTTLKTHINTLAGHRANVGANISRLNMVASQLGVYGENLAAANSRIADVDVATESANYAKQQILMQSGTAMLAQANVMPQAALMLLQ